MHRSRFAGFIIDCLDADLNAAATFWGGALGMSTLGRDVEKPFIGIDASSRDLHVEVQRVAHASRVHLDIVTDNLEAEVLRLELLGARRVERIHSWWIMEAPTGHRFCVIQTAKNLDGLPGTTVWP